MFCPYCSCHCHHGTAPYPLHCSRTTPVRLTTVVKAASITATATIAAWRSEVCCCSNADGSAGTGNSRNFHGGSFGCGSIGKLVVAALLATVADAVAALLALNLQVLPTLPALLPSIPLSRCNTHSVPPPCVPKLGPMMQSNSMLIPIAW